MNDLKVLFCLAIKHYGSHDQHSCLSSIIYQKKKYLYPLKTHYDYKHIASILSIIYFLIQN